MKAASGEPQAYPIVHRARYGISLALHALLLAACLYGLAVVHGVAEFVALALVMALAVVQLGGLAHDAAHRQIVRGRHASEVLGMALWNFGCGISLAWWRDKHLRHHRYPHQAGHDPDLYDVFAFDPVQAARRRGLLRWIARWQAAAFVALLACTAAYFQLLSLGFLLHRRPRRWRLEMTALLARHALFFGAVFGLPEPANAALFVLVHYVAVGWYMGAVFATNHYGLPVQALAPAGDPEHVFAVTRNVRAGALGDYLFCGLNYQIEHHLQPQLPRFALREAALRLREQRRRVGLPYLETGWSDALCAVLRQLHDAGARLRDPRAA